MAIMRCRLPCMMIPTILILAITATYSSTFKDGPGWASAAAAIRCRYPTLFVFGDSLSDTGNCYYSGNLVLCQRTNEYPYGETYPAAPAKRFSDGRLLLDFLATYLQLPLLNPYLNMGANMTRGVNYAVSGATAIDAMKLLTTYNILSLTPLSLHIQLLWHSTLKATVDSLASVGLTFPGRPTQASFTNGLYVVEIGGNDYINAFNAGLSPSFVNTTLVPQVISKIINATQTLYTNGARNFLFISVTPLGCSPSLLNNNNINNGSKDAYGCLVNPNSVSKTHSDRLLEEVINLRATHPTATFSFLNYYDAYRHILRNPTTFGFTNTLGTCCGTGNPNNLPLFCNFLITTLNPSMYLCPNPNVYLNWDGIHFTDAFNAQVANQTIITGTYLDPSDALTGYCVGTANSP